MSKCDKCKNYEPKQPEIRALSKEQFDKAKSDNDVWKRVYYSGRARVWETSAKYNSLWAGFRYYGNYGLPVIDPFWKEWDEMQKRKPKVDDWAVVGDSRKPIKLSESDADHIRFHNLKWEYATSSDFTVKRNGHEWLLVDGEDGWYSLIKDGKEIETFWDEDIILVLNLPVCPAEVM